MTRAELKEYLDDCVDRYNRPEFIQDDPIQIPHLFTNPRDVEIAGYLVATIAWGQRKTILNNGHRLLDIMGHEPYNYVMNASSEELEELSFIHRTFNSEDLRFLIEGLREIYLKNNSLESSFLAKDDESNLFPAITRFRTELIGNREVGRSGKHIANPEKGAASKRIHMFLRWMVRNDNRGVDFGIWTNLSPSLLSCPLDVHTGNTARSLKLLKRKQNDRRAVEELDVELRRFDSADPIKYDFALFGIGVDPLVKFE